MAFKEITPYEITENPFALIGQNWMLITAGDAQNCNTMTASWGQLGIMWGKPVAQCYIRPQRYTRQFVEAQPRYSLSFFNSEAYRPALNLLGTKSGRDGDKIAEAGLHTTQLGGAPAFEEASLVLVCRKLYVQDLKAENFLEQDIVQTMYPAQDFHRMYVGEIEKVFVK